MVTSTSIYTKNIKKQFFASSCADELEKFNSILPSKIKKKNYSILFKIIKSTSSSV
jgi:hypothetical protein